MTDEGEDHKSDVKSESTTDINLSGRSLEELPKRIVDKYGSVVKKIRSDR